MLIVSKCLSRREISIGKHRYCLRAWLELFKATGIGVDRGGFSSTLGFAEKEGERAAL